jgi:hypothetical protein
MAAVGSVGNLESTFTTINDHVEVNGYGPIYLYQAVYPLLKKSKKPTFVGVGSADTAYRTPDSHKRGLLTFLKQRVDRLVKVDRTVAPRLWESGVR